MDEPIIVVTGLPRSGTSMLMQMLQAGGLPVLADQHRPNDIHNPRGYLEYEPAKMLARDNAWVRQAGGRAVKVIVQLLPYLPREFHYKVLMMQRPITDVIASQNKMLLGLGQSPAAEPAALAAIFERQVNAAIQWLAEQPRMTSLTLGYTDCVANPLGAAKSIADFLCPLRVDPIQMVLAVDPSLQRTSVE